MATPTVQSLSSSLRVFRHLDLEALSPEFIQKVTQEEGTAEYVDSDRARDYEWTEEIMAATIGAALVGEDGDMIREWDGPNAVTKAYAARSSAKLTFSMEIEDEAAVEDDE